MRALMSAVTIFLPGGREYTNKRTIQPLKAVRRSQRRRERRRTAWLIMRRRRGEEKA